MINYYIDTLKTDERCARVFIENQFYKSQPQKMIVEDIISLQLHGEINFTFTDVHMAKYSTTEIIHIQFSPQSYTESYIYLESVAFCVALW